MKSRRCYASLSKNLENTFKPLYVLRHLVVFIKKQVTGARFYSSPCWELIQKWEELEPAVRRVPIPSALLRAMAVVSFIWAGPFLRAPFRLLSMVLMTPDSCRRPSLFEGARPEAKKKRKRADTTRQCA